jgi:hypothetical protein
MNIKWKHPSSPTAQKFNKIMATAICEHKGVLFVDHGDTVTAGHSCAKRERLEWDICCKRVGLLHQDIIILHDNAWPHATN